MLKEKNTKNIANKKLHILKLIKDEKNNKKNNYKKLPKAFEDLLKKSANVPNNEKQKKNK